MILTARPAPKPFAQKPRIICRTKSVKAHAFKVTLDTPDGVSEIECDGKTFILDAAEISGVELPYSCRAGACSSCLGLVTEGEVDQSAQSFLDPAQEDEGWVLTCIAYPSSDCTIKTHREKDIYPDA